MKMILGRNRIDVIARTVVLGWLLFSSAGRLAAAVRDPASGYTPGPMLERFLEGPMADVDEIVFAVRVPGRDHWYVTFGNYSDHSTKPRDLCFKEQDVVLWGYV